MAKPELGTKRLCVGCGAKFYDLNQTRPSCPKCGVVFEIAPVTARSRPDQAAARPAAAREVEVATPEPAEAEIISLEEADAEAQGKKRPAGEEVEIAEDVEADEAIEGTEDTFIEEQEEEDTDVTEIIGGDIENDEET